MFECGGDIFLFVVGRNDDRKKQLGRDNHIGTTPRLR